MAIPDPKILELTVVLTELGLDWLAIELLEGIREGRLPEERPGDLESARGAVRLGTSRERAKEFWSVLPPVPEELRGDDQLDWAADYITERIADLTAMLDASLEQLKTVGNQGKLSDSLSRERDHGQFELTLQMGEEGPMVVEKDVVRARDNLPALRNALRAWSRGSHGQA